jgi:hypothetical protein
MGSRSAGVDTSGGILSIKKRKGANHLKSLEAVGKILPLPARMLSIAAKNQLEICRYW